MLKCTADLYPRCTQLDVQYSPNSYTNYVVTPVQVFAMNNVQMVANLNSLFCDRRCLQTAVRFSSSMSTNCVMMPMQVSESTAYCRCNIPTNCVVMPMQVS